MLRFFLTGSEVSNKLAIGSQTRGSLAVKNLLETVSRNYGAILIAPPWRFANGSGKDGSGA